eukprot:scaffold32020_cov57-Phaeocystis_antarctica.AAC.2
MGELAFGKLLAELSSHRGACDWVESALGRICGDYSLDPSPQFACGYADVRGEGVKKRLRAARQPNKGCAA